MPFLHITSVTSMDTTYDIAFCLLPNEEEQTYDFAIQSLLQLFKGVGRTLRIFITNYKVALKNCLKAHFLEVLQRACL
jgi:hypothetical protein